MKIKEKEVEILLKQKIIILLVLYMITYFLMINGEQLIAGYLTALILFYIFAIIMDYITKIKRRLRFFITDSRDDIISDDSETLKKFKEESKDYIKIRGMEKEKLLIEYGRTLDFNELMLIKNIKSVDKSFNERLFLKMTHDIAIELIKTKIVKNMSAKYLYQAINKRVIQFDYPNYSSFKKNDNYYTLKLKIDEKIAVHKVDPSTNDIIFIDKNNNSIDTYELTYIKLIDNDKTKNCPRCGAPLRNNLFSICNYCFKFIDGEKKEKIKSQVTKISYDIPMIEFEKVMPENCLSCGAILKEEAKGVCEYCKSNNNPAENKWVLVQFEKISD